MCENKLERLEEELKKYEKRLSRMQKNWAATKSGSAYGEEYLEIQIKVYGQMIVGLKKEILKLSCGFEERAIEIQTKKDRLDSI